MELLSTGRTVWLICYLSGQTLVPSFPPRCVQTPGMSCGWPETLNRGTLWVALGWMVSIRTPRPRTFCALIVFSGPVYPQSRAHNQHFRRLRQSWRQVACLDWVVSMLIHKLHWPLNWLNLKSFWSLMWVWLAFLFWAICGMGWTFQPSWEHTFCNNLRLSGIAVVPFSILGNLSLPRNFWIFQACGKIPSGETLLPRFQTVWLQNDTLLLSVSILLGECNWWLPECSGKVRIIVDCNPNIVHVLSTLVSFDNCVQILAHETWKNWHRPVSTMCKSSVNIGSAGKIECKRFHWPLVRHRQTVIGLWAIKLSEKVFPARCFAASDEVLTGWLLFF